MQNFPVVRIALDFSRSFLSLCGLFRFVSVAAGGLHFPMQNVKISVFCAVCQYYKSGVRFGEQQISNKTQ